MDTVVRCMRTPQQGARGYCSKVSLDSATRRKVYLDIVASCTWTLQQDVNGHCCNVYLDTKAKCILTLQQNVVGYDSKV